MLDENCSELSGFEDSDDDENVAEIDKLLNDFNEEIFELSDDDLLENNSKCHEVNDQLQEIEDENDTVVNHDNLQYFTVDKKQINWINKPFEPPSINLNSLEYEAPSELHDPIFYFSKYYGTNDFENMAF